MGHAKMMWSAVCSLVPHSHFAFQDLVMQNCIFTILNKCYSLVTQTGLILKNKCMIDKTFMVKKCNKYTLCALGFGESEAFHRML